MKTIPFFALLTLALFTFSACEKGGDVVDPPSNTELLADGPWERVAQIVDPPVDVSGTPVSNEFAQLQACFTDNILDFTETGSYTIDEGQTKCDSTNLQLFDSGTWSFSDNETKLTFDGTSGTEQFNVVSISRDKVVMSQTFTDNNLTFTRTFTFEDIN